MRIAALYFTQALDISEVAEHFLRFSPQICLRESDSGSAIFIEIGKCQRLFSERGFTLRALGILKRLKINATIGIADNISQSLVKAIYETCAPTHLPLKALYDFTDPFCKDSAARVQIAVMIEALSKLAVRNLDEFIRIPNQNLTSRFGKAALLCKLRVTNELLVPWKEWRPKETIVEFKDLTEADHTGGLEPLLFEIKALLDRMFSRLWSRGLKLTGLKLTVRTEKLSTLLEHKREFNFDFISPQSSTKGTLGIIKVRLEKDFLTKPLKSLVDDVELKVTSHVPGFLSQKNIFHSREELDESLGALINQLSESHGQDNIFYANTVEDRLPEKSWIKTNSLNAQILDLNGLMPNRPMYLVTPEKIEVTAGQVFIKRKPFPIKSWAQYVEFISSQWLEKQIDRNYYQVEVENGPTLWVYQDLQKNYFLHGYYG